MNFVRAVSTEGFGRLRFYEQMAARLERDAGMRAYFEGRSKVLPRFYADWIRRDLGPLYAWLPAGALEHDPYAYLAEATAESRLATAVAG